MGPMTGGHAVPHSLHASSYITTLLGNWAGLSAKSGSGKALLDQNAVLLRN